MWLGSGRIDVESARPNQQGPPADPQPTSGFGSVPGVPTPHIAAEPGDLAPVVLLPGDPRRARWIADTFLHGARQVTAVRDMVGFTGSYDGMAVSVMGTGMGLPSMCLYATELVTAYGCTDLIRVGSCGAIQADLDLGDIVVAIGACTDSAVNRQRFAGWDFAATADFTLLAAVVEAAHAAGDPVWVGNVLSSDLFYPPHGVPPMQHYAPATAMGVLAVEMEAAGLYGVAAEHRARAVAVCTVSDQLVHGRHLDVAAREQGLAAMVAVALAGAAAARSNGGA